MINRQFIKILIIEDNPADARLIREQLKDLPSFAFSWRCAESLAAGIAALAANPVDVVLLDLSLPDSRGIETLHRVVAGYPQVPVVVITGQDDEGLAVQAVQEGAQDYLIKGQPDQTLLSRSLRYAIERKRSEGRLIYLATHDALTELPNRTLFLDRLSQALQRAARRRHANDPKWMVSVFMLDLNDFKWINDTLGHRQGDSVLRTVGQRFKNCVRQADTVARFGGDEFTFVLEGVGGIEDCEIVARKIHATLLQPVELEGNSYNVMASIGISIFPEDGEDGETLLKNADAAMYRAKRQGVWFCFS